MSESVINKIEGSNPLVSVVVPVFKVEYVIERTLRSIANQTYKNIELILVDDGTPDKSVEVATNYLDGMNINWRVFHQENQGLPTARNNGIKEAKGEWVICPDSDDYIAPQTIEKMIEAATKTSSDCVFCGFKSVNDNNYDALPEHEGGVVVYDMPKLRKLFLERKLIVLVPGMLLRRKLYDVIQYDKDCPHDEDIHFMWRLFYTLEKVAYLDADYYNYYVRSTSMSHTLKPEAYLKTSERYQVMTAGLAKQFPDDEIVPLIHPKYRLGGLHVLAKSADYSTFKNTIIKDGYRKDMIKLVTQSNIKLKLYALIYCLCLPLFYRISK